MQKEKNNQDYSDQGGRFTKQIRHQDLLRSNQRECEARIEKFIPNLKKKQNLYNDKLEVKIVKIFLLQSFLFHPEIRFYHVLFQK